MKTIQVKAVKRENYGKKAAKAVRREGQIPAVLYGGGETVSFSVDPREIKPLIYTPNSYIVDLEIDDVGVGRVDQPKKPYSATCSSTPSARRFSTWTFIAYSRANP